MTPAVIICIMITILVVLSAWGLIFFNQRQMKGILNQLNKMVEEAIAGNLIENRYDESRLSALEIKLKQYLQQNAVGSKRLQMEKDNTYTLISDISHQTKTPIANISIYSELLLEQDLPEESKLYAQQIKGQVHKLQFLIESMIKTSRLENGIISIVAKENNVKRMLDQVVEQLLLKSVEKRIKIEINMEHPEDKAYFDHKWTVEAIYNIVDNAVKYTYNNDIITIKGQPYELFYRVDITDHGMGINEGEKNKVFARFYRSERVKEVEGVGIGLYLTYQIVLLENGYLKVNSESGKGTTFSVFLPRIGE